MDDREWEGMSSGAEKVENIERAAAQERMAAQRRVAEARNRMKEEAEKQKARKQGDSMDGDFGGSSENSGGASSGNSGDEMNGNGGSNHRDQNGGNGKKKRGDGLGGWIAAVVSLGAVTLVLSAVVTVGAIRMGQDNASVAGGYRGTVYEFIHIAEEIDDDLDTLRISESPSKQAEILTNILVQTRMAEMGLEKLPYDSHSEEKTMRFLNGISKFCEDSLEKLSRGEELGEWDKRHVENLYTAQHKVREKLDELAACCEDKDVTGMMRGKKSCITETLQELENELAEFPTLTEKQPREKKDEKPTPSMPNGETQPSQNAEKTAAQGDETAQPAKKEMKDRAGVSSQKAEEICKYYFAEYGVTDTVYGGESLGKGLKAYNFTMTTDKGVEIFAEISQKDGALIYFDYYEECNRHVHDIETAKNTAQAFLNRLGYENMVPVRVDESGTNADFTFAYQMDGCIYYPDEIVVKVCEERGVVSGMDASRYLKKHGDRYALSANITMQQARENLSDKLTVEASETVLFEHKGREVLAYEFFCSYDGKLYFVYVDAMDGRELYIVNSNRA